MATSDEQLEITIGNLGWNTAKVGKAMFIRRGKYRRYLNLTKVCNNYSTRSGRPREFRKWFRSKETCALIKALAVSIGIDESELTYVPNCNNDKRGTYIHSALIPGALAWISPSLTAITHPFFEKWVSKGNNRDLYDAALASICSGRNNMAEACIQATLAKLLGAEREVKCHLGKIDLLTPTMLIEVKGVRGWLKAVGQVIIYGDSYPDRMKVIYLFGLGDRKADPEMVRTCLNHDIFVVTTHQELLDLERGD